MNHQPTKAEIMTEELREHYAAPTTKNNQVAAMLTVQNILLQEVQAMLRDLVTNANQATARDRALILIKAITDNNYPMGAVLDIRPVLIALKQLSKDATGDVV